MMPRKQRMKMALVLMATTVAVTAPVAPTNTDSKRPPNGKSCVACDAKRSL